MIAVLLVGLAASPDGGTPDAGTWTDDPIYAECPAAPLPTELPDGSWMLSPLRSSRNACLMGSCEADRQGLKKTPPPFGWFTWALTALVGGLALAGGLYLGFELRSLFGR